MKKYIIIIILLLLNSNAFAQKSDVSMNDIDNNFELNDTVKKKKRKVLDEVQISVSNNKDVPKIGKANIKPLDLPQATSIIGKEIIAQQQILRISDVLKNTNGVYISGANNAAGNNQEEIGARGFTFNGGNTFKNGVRFNNSIIPETSSLENIEVLKGSAALLYGNVAPGGILNLITKKPKFNIGGEVNFRAGEFGFYKPTIDIYGSLNESNNIAYRLNTSFEKGNSFRDEVVSERFYINPSLLFEVSNKTSILVEGDYLKDSRTPDFGLTTIDYNIIDQPRNTFLGFNWGTFDTKQSSFTTTISHDLPKNWLIKGIYSYQNFSTNLLSSLRPNSTNLVQANGDWIRGVQKNDRTENYNLAEIDLTGNIKTGTVNHSLLIGLDGDITNSSNLIFKNIVNYNTINIFNPSVILKTNPVYNGTLIPSFDKNTETSSTIKRAGLYVQDLLTVSTKIKVLAGLRYSHLNNYTNTNAFTNNIATAENIINNIITSKLGIVYQPTDKNSIFLSYADSFSPNVGTNRFFETLPVSSIDQYELGFKNELFNKNLSLNLTGYIINNDNLAQTDFTNGNLNTNIKELTGALKSQGFEVDLTGRYKEFKLLAGYSFNETKYTKSNIFDTGTLFRFTPKHTANASVFYNFKENTMFKGLEIGIINSYVGERLGGRLRPNNAKTEAELARKPIVTSSFNQTDISLGYTIKSVVIRAKLSNVSNVLNYYAYDDNTVTPIAPRNIVTTISYKF